ncbi:tetratricopeptide repeat protein, partial [bacterium]
MLIFALSLGIYSKACGLGLTGDDLFAISHARNLFANGWLGTLFLAAPKKTILYGSYSPISLVVLRLADMAGGGAPFAFHAISVVLHAACAVFAFSIFKRFMGRPFALWAALFFAVHPALTETVFHISALPHLLTAFFVLMAAHFLVLEASGVFVPSSARFWGGLAMLCALFSGEAAFLAPLGLFALDSSLSDGGANADARRRRWLIEGSFLCSVYLAARIPAFGFPEWGPPEGPTGIWAFVKYLGLISIPVPLYARHEGGVPPLLAFTSAAMTLFVFIYYALRERGGRAAFAWALLFLLSALGVLPWSSPRFSESGLYLPVLGFCLTAGIGAESHSRIYIGQNIRFILYFLLFPLLVVTFMRAEVWRSDKNLYEHIADSNPDYAEGHIMLGAVFMAEGLWSDSTSEYLVAATLNPSDPRAYEGAAKSSFMLGKYNMAERFYEKAVELSPGDAKLRYGYANVLHNQQKHSQEEGHLIAVIALDPEHYA